MTLRVSVRTMAGLDRWETLLHTAMNPHLPTLSEAISAVLTQAEADRLMSSMRRRFETVGEERLLARAYLWAIKSDAR